MQPVTAASQVEALAAGIAAALWLAMIVLVHFIKPELKPSGHMLSEYARKPKGWMMQVAFFCVAISCLALALAAGPYLSTAGLILLVVVGLGFAGAGAFVTDPLEKKGPATKSGAMHNLFSFIVIPVFPVMATVVSISLAHNAGSAPLRAWLSALSVLTWAGFVSFLGSPVVALLTHKHMPVGYTQRFMVFTYTLWLIVVSLALT
jgi:hypothetical protein